MRGNVDSGDTYWQNGPCIEIQSSLMGLRLADGEAHSKTQIEDCPSTEDQSRLPI